MLLFDAYPKIDYFGKNAVNILVRAAIVKKVIEKVEVFYDYVITDGERPDTIASDYYGDPTFDWLVLMSNQILDVYSQWPKPYNVFLDYLQDKYGYVNQLMSEIHHYKYEGDNQLRYIFPMTPATFAELSSIEKFGWVPVYTYDWEDQLNEQKRTIRLISNDYISQIKQELGALFK